MLRAFVPQMGPPPQGDHLFLGSVVVLGIIGIVAIVAISLRQRIRSRRHSQADDLSPFELPKAA